MSIWKSWADTWAPPSMLQHAYAELGKIDKDVASSRRRKQIEIWKLKNQRPCNTQHEHATNKVSFATIIASCFMFMLHAIWFMPNLRNAENRSGSIKKSDKKSRGKIGSQKTFERREKSHWWQGFEKGRGIGKNADSKLDKLAKTDISRKTIISVKVRLMTKLNKSKKS